MSALTLPSHPSIQDLEAWYPDVIYHGDEDNADSLGITIKTEECRVKHEKEKCFILEVMQLDSSLGQRLDLTVMSYIYSTCKDILRDVCEHWTILIELFPNFTIPKDFEL